MIRREDSLGPLMKKSSKIVLMHSGNPKKINKKDWDNLFTEKVTIPQ